MSDKIVFSGKIEQIRRNDARFNYPRVLLLDCVADGDVIRKHMWIKLSKNQLKSVVRGKHYIGTCVIEKYLNIDTLEKDKLGFVRIKNLSMITEGLHDALKKQTT